MVICDLENCKRKLNNETDLFHHKWRCHPSELTEDEKKKTSELPNRFPCSCGKLYSTKSHRNSHLRTNNPAIHVEQDYRDLETKHYDKQKCDLCGELLLLSKILDHVKSHVGEDYVYRCPNQECPFIYTNSLSWQRHFSHSKICRQISFEKMSDPSLCCESCGIKMKNRLMLENHVRNEHEKRRRRGRGQFTTEKKWMCPMKECGKLFGVKQSIYFHLRVHRYRPPITKQSCNKCGESFKVEEMEGHLKEEHGIVEVIGCKQCKMKFSGRDEMVEHIWEHRGSGFSCDICGDDKQDRFLRYCDLREHYFGMHQLCPKKYKCGECDMMFWRSREVDMHKEDKHKEEKGKGAKRKKGHATTTFFACEICGDDGSVRFQKEDYLISHKIKVHGEDPFTCDICGKTFVAKNKFTRYEKEHAGIPVQKEWKCEVEGCGRIFNKNMLKSHMKVVHGGERYVCEDCGKGFASAPGLKRHRDTVHLGLRPWVCEECGERFTSSSTPKKHKLIHTGERPFGCEICGQRFRHKEVLKTHLKGHEEKGADFKPNGPMKQIRKRKHVD